MGKAIEIQSPNKISTSIGWDNANYVSIFLGGSIEMGSAEDWQKKLIGELDNSECILLNPRRDDWNSDWEQSISNPYFKEQVDWELDALDMADIIVMYFDPNTKSPISLLELGIYANSGKMIVICPDGFWRKGNVDIVCERYGVTQVTSFDELTNLIKNKINEEK